MKNFNKAHLYNRGGAVSSTQSPFVRSAPTQSPFVRSAPTQSPFVRSAPTQPPFVRSAPPTQSPLVRSNDFIKIEKDSSIPELSNDNSEISFFEKGYFDPHKQTNINIMNTISSPVFIIGGIICLGIFITLIVFAVKKFKGGRNMNKKTLILKLYYVEWCGHCNNFKPIWKKLQKQNISNVKFKAIDCDKHKNIAQADGIEGFPTIRLYNSNNKLLDELEGERNIKNIKNLIKKHK